MNFAFLLLVIVEEPNKRVEQPPVMTEEMAKAIAAVKAVAGVIDKLLDKVVAFEVSVSGGVKVALEEFDMTAELLMRQLLKLDGIEAEGEARIQRKAEVRRVQKLQEAVDTLNGKMFKPEKCMN